MLRERWYEQAPWMFATPVRPSRFVPLSPADAVYDVEVDLSALGPFGGAVADPDGAELLYADYRTVKGLFLRRIGAGRSGYYRNAYLKGVGRTPLALNWWQPGNYFGTGHLPASGGTRELVVSRYFQAKGKGQLINPCRGLLVAELVPELRDPRAWLLPWELPPLACDTALQSITVKDAGFARFSNVMWHLDHLSLYKGEADLIRFFTHLVSGLVPDRAIAPAEIRPSVIAQALAATIDRAVQGYREYWRLGVSWLSVHADLTMDGRYQDIDTPLLHGPGYLGAIAKLEAYTPGTPVARFPLDVSWAAISGFDVLEYLHAMRLFVRHLRAMLNVYVSSEFAFSRAERDFIHGVVHAVGEALPPDHLLWSGSACATLLRGWIDEECEVPARERETVDALVASAVCERLDASGSAPLRLPVTEVALDCARSGSRVKLTEAFYALAGTTPRPERLEEIQLLNTLIKQLDAITDRDELCARSREAEQTIARYCGA